MSGATWTPGFKRPVSLLYKWLLLSSLASLFSFFTHAEQVGIEIGVEGRYFSESSFLAGYNHSVSSYFEVDIYNSWKEETDSLSISLFGRKDERDRNRTHFELREFSWIHVNNSWEVRSGVREVFWGVTEALHLVDIINQSDFAENFDGEDKLGQPMVNLSIVKDTGIFDLYLLPKFRERTFPGVNSRLRTPIVVNEDIVFYESKKKQSHRDFAARWNHYFGNWEIGLSYFNGTNRDPRFASNITPDSFEIITVAGEDVPVLKEGFIPQLFAIYDQIDQAGIDVQYIYEGLAIKLEVVKRSGECWTNKGSDWINFCDDTYTRAVGGFEFTQTGIYGSVLDLGWVIEGMFDDRGDAGPSPVEHDVLIAHRYAFNNTSDASILVGVFWDPETEEKSMTLEASRRLGESTRVFIEARIFDPKEDPLSLTNYILGQVNPDPEEKLRVFGDEDMIKLDLVFYL